MRAPGGEYGVRTPLVTGAGSAAGIAVLAALRDAGVPAVAADPDRWAAGFALASASGVLPLPSDPAFIVRLCELAARTRVDAVISTVADELVPLGIHATTLRRAGFAVWVPSPEVVRLCVDKWAFARRLRRAGIPTPMTARGRAEGVPGPWIVKPRYGSGSSYLYPVERPDELHWALRRVPDGVVQTRLSGREFAVDALVGPDGTFAGGVARWRKESSAGISTKGETFLDEAVLAGTANLLDVLGLRGIANVKGFVTGGEVAFFEVNPWFSEGLPLSRAAGADLVGEYLRGLAGLPLRPERLAYRPGVRMSRYFSEVFEG